MGNFKNQVRHCPTTIRFAGIFLVTGLGLSCSHRGSVVVGGACSADEACTTNVCIRGGKASPWVGGYCSGNCAIGTLDCPQGDCLTFDDGRSFCVAECRIDDDCRKGYICSPGVGFCLPDCRDGWSCGERLLCDGATGACIVPASLVGTAPFGAACISWQECVTGLCLHEQDNGGNVAWRGGMCSQECDTAAACPGGAPCVHFEDGSAYCVPSCAATTCREGYVCSAEINGCLPDCRLGWDCGERFVCDATTGACVLPPGNAPFGSVCSENRDCASALCIPERDDAGAVAWSGGMCSLACAAACPGGAPCVHFEDGSAYCVPSCAAEAECRAGYICSAEVGGCLPDCRLGWDCGERFVCDAATGACAPPPGNAPIGSVCTYNVECASGLCIAESSESGAVSWTGGTCSLKCEAAADCPAGATCVHLEDGNAYCAVSCAATTECRAGYVCSAGACLPDCRLGWDCGVSLLCDETTGACMPPPGTVPLGLPCTDSAQCVSALCIPERSDSGAVSWTGGTCSQECTITACPAGATCARFDDGSAYCVPSCTSAAECRAGYACSTGISACLPDCRLGWDCGQRLVCDATTGTCTLSTTTTGDTPLGDPCTLGAECTSGYCIAEAGSASTVAWSGGACSQECTSAACPDGATCVPMEDGSAYCAPSCTSTAACRTDYICDIEVFACLPDCRLGWSCGTRLVCDAASGSCVLPSSSDAGVPDGGYPDGGAPDAGASDAGWRGPGDSGGSGQGGNDAGRGGGGAGPGGMLAERSGLPL